MPQNLLTDAEIRTATVPEGKRVAKLFDGEGLEVWVFPIKRKPGRPKKGTQQFARRWRFTYRRPTGGGKNTIAVGASGGDYPAVGLAAARELANALRRQLAEGIDPGQKRKADKQAREHAAANTFNHVADEWLAKQRAIKGDAERSSVTLDKLTWLLSLVRPDIGARPIAEITPMQCLAALKKIEARGRYDTARRSRATMSRVFKLAVATGRAVNDPTAALLGDDVFRTHCFQWQRVHSASFPGAQLARHSAEWRSRLT
jgi:hypothetical protein